MYKYTTSSLSMWPNQSAGQGFFSSIAIAISLMKREDKGEKTTYKICVLSASLQHSVAASYVS